MPSSAAKPIRTHVDRDERGDVVAGEITAGAGGEELGRLIFEDYPDTKGGRQVKIALVRVAEGHRRKGIATKMVARLRKEVPSSTLAPPALNAAGRELMRKIYDRFAEPLNRRTS